MKAQAVLKLVRESARKNELRLRELEGRGKGGHRMFVILDSGGTEVGRFGLTTGSKDISWGVLRATETGLAHLFGEKWMEK